MGQKEKLIKRLKSKPKDFTFAELETLLRYLSYELDNKGRTSGSRVMFVRNKQILPFFEVVCFAVIGSNHAILLCSFFLRQSIRVSQ